MKNGQFMLITVTALSQLPVRVLLVGVNKAGNYLVMYCTVYSVLQTRPVLSSSIFLGNGTVRVTVVLQ